MGAIDAVAKWEHVTPELIESVLDRFRGDIMQMPPVCVYSLTFLTSWWPRS